MLPSSPVYQYRYRVDAAIVNFLVISPMEVPRPVINRTAYLKTQTSHYPVGRLQACVRCAPKSPLTKSAGSDEAGT